MDGMESIKQTFFLECEDLLSELESGLIELNDGGGDKETVNAVFRAVHSIKGGAGAFNLTDLVSFAHTFENVLDDVRSDKLESTPEVLTLLLQSSDMLNDLVTAARDDADWDKDHAKTLLDKLKVYSGEDTDDSADGSGQIGGATMSEDYGFEPMAMGFDFGDDLPELSNNTSYEITFKPQPTLFENGNSATRLLRNLGQLGEMSVECDLSALPHFDDINPDAVYANWTITLETEASEDDIQEIFEFAIDDCELIVEKKESEALESDPLAAFSLPDLDLSDSDMIDSDAPIEEAPALSLPELETDLASTNTEEIPETESVKKKAPDDKPKIAAKAAPPATIRINLERVDRLINLVGELVINQAMLNECVMESGMGRDPSVLSGLDEFKQLTRDIQESVMAIRAQPVKPLFQRMSRIVREAAQATEKSAKLVMEGEFTEVDKTIVEKLADPLTHMIRNAIDHGLEMPDEREANGKPRSGTVKLSASHRSGKIVIEVSDDGAGINRERVKKIAIDKGLISEDAALTDSEIDNLLFMAGFSTVEKVSTLSGRGVGMDVVKRAIQSIGGRITISSEPGKGSTFSINLPLTLAVLDGMLVKVADQTIVVPLTAIVETLLPAPGDIHMVSPDNPVINVRGNFIPLIHLGKALNFDSHRDENKPGVVLCIETEDGQTAAISVDHISDQRQVVIKSLEDNYGVVPCIAAATILGNGSIALILDVDDLILRNKAAPKVKSNIIAATVATSIQEPAYV